MLADDGIRSELTENQKKEEKLEARVGIEPTHKGFADLSLTTWVPRPCSIQRPDESVSGARASWNHKKSGAGDGI